MGEVQSMSILLKNEFSASIYEIEDLVEGLQ